MDGAIGPMGQAYLEELAASVSDGHGLTRKDEVALIREVERARAEAYHLREERRLSRLLVADLKKEIAAMEFKSKLQSGS